MDEEAKQKLKVSVYWSDEDIEIYLIGPQSVSNSNPRVHAKIKFESCSVFEIVLGKRLLFKLKEWSMN